MPHSSKKYRKQEQIAGSRTSTYIVIAIIAAIVVGAGAWYVYGSMRSVTTGQQTLTGSSVQTVVTIDSSHTVTMNMTRNSNGTYVIYATIYTSVGNIEVELFPQSAPKSVANFVNLAKSGFYDNLLWHRIMPGFVIQAGDPTTKNGGGNPSTWGQNNGPVALPLEIDPNLHNAVGALALANTGAADSSGSQFYINLGNNTYLDGKYTVFGQVIGGMNVATAISKVQPVNSSTGTPESSSAYVYIRNITIVNIQPSTNTTTT